MKEQLVALASKRSLGVRLAGVRSSTRQLPAINAANIDTRQLGLDADQSGPADPEGP